MKRATFLRNIAAALGLAALGPRIASKAAAKQPDKVIPPGDYWMTNTSPPLIPRWPTPPEGYAYRISWSAYGYGNIQMTRRFTHQGRPFKVTAEASCTPQQQQEVMALMKQELDAFDPRKLKPGEPWQHWTYISSIENLPMSAMLEPLP